jgi:ribonuclease HI
MTGRAGMGSKEGAGAGAAGGDLARALRRLASGRAIADTWRESGYASESALAAEVNRLADRLASGSGNEARGRVGPVAGRGARARPAAGEGALSVVAYSDGASSGNPGQAGCGVVIMSQSGEVLLEDYKYIGKTTNNVAEYEGALLALTRAHQMGAATLELKVDSDLLANQIRGVYRVKSANLARLYQDLKELWRRFERFDVTLIRRSENKQADRLANLAIASHKTE